MRSRFLLAGSRQFLHQIHLHWAVIEELHAPFSTVQQCFVCLVHWSFNNSLYLHVLMVMSSDAISPQNPMKKCLFFQKRKTQHFTSGICLSINIALHHLYVSVCLNPKRNSFNLIKLAYYFLFIQNSHDKPCFVKRCYNQMTKKKKIF